MTLVPNILVCGVVRNVEGTLKNDLNRLRRILSFSHSVRWLLIESDSSDRTVEILESLSAEDPLFNFKSLGTLKETFSLRTERLAYCRNLYLEELRNNSLYHQVDYVIIVDLDGITSKLGVKSIEAALKVPGWDVMTANQTGPYYDIWALRHPQWSPNDCWSQYRALMDQGYSHELAHYFSVEIRMIRLSPRLPLIEVQSAFGGLAIYRASALRHPVTYSGLSNGFETCEHVGLHQDITTLGGRIVINPRLVTSKYTEHTTFLHPAIRRTADFRRASRAVLSGVIGASITNRIFESIQKVFGLKQ